MPWTCVPCIEERASPGLSGPGPGPGLFGRGLARRARRLAPRSPLARRGSLKRLRTANGASGTLPLPRASPPNPPCASPLNPGCSGRGSESLRAAAGVDLLAGSWRGCWLAAVRSARQTFSAVGKSRTKN
eukprot:CAMPEP_0179947116 /NCGR_PEP_ID=MMETSP0983-20121128/20806_1 /TAXON_ID=483367 /ORGANISM="non described non described, Strain CCMP 2436" /LENGTH=129 /DNA_ID=CAMNT_0021856119 /DNA_START=633 /DNA_END=1022 /DNA_ORIENTATION=+